MKQKHITLSICLTFSFILQSCLYGDKVIIPEETNNFTCNDGVQNQGETGIDCGGPCPECFTAPPCQPGEDRVIFGGSTNYLPPTSCSQSIGDDDFEIGYYSQLEIFIDKTPLKSATYTVDPASWVTGSNARVVYYPGGWGSTPYYGQSGDLYVEVKGDTVSATFCNIPFKTESGSTIITGSGNATVNDCL